MNNFKKDNQIGSLFIKVNNYEMVSYDFKQLVKKLFPFFLEKD